ncbi:MAG: oligopeptide/dipeptide ABC transporter ATP-binding protein, partial [Nocardioidaceae bacterium]
FAGLSFLGLGVQAPQYDWGRLLGEGLDGIYIHPLPAVAPGVAVVVTGLAFNLFGESAAKVLGMSTRLPRYDGLPQPASTVTASPGDAESSTGTARAPLLTAENLTVAFPQGQQWVTPVRGVSLQMDHGESVGVVGESGSGKSLTALAIAQLIEHPGRVTADRLHFEDETLVVQPGRSSRQRQRRRLGTSLAMVFQDPTASFNPTIRVGRQLAEVSRYHHGLSRREALLRAVDRLRAVRVPAAERRAHQYPHEFSGGMLQRAMVGMGVMGTPKLILADEPTTSLDVTVQRQVLRLLAQIRSESDVAMLLISHDIGVVRQVCDRVLVMYAGRVVEDLPTTGLHQPRHPYTYALLNVAPDMETDRSQPLAVIPGRPVEPAEIPRGCAFAARCPLADERCRDEDPPLARDSTGHRVACWHAGEITQAAPRSASPSVEVGHE